jgi:hypothetical protein
MRPGRLGVVVKDVDLALQLVRWLESPGHLPGTLRNLHCRRVWESVPGPSLGDVTAVSVRHHVPLVSRAPELFVVDLWDLRPGEVGDADAARMCARLAAYRAWYDELLEDAEVAGRRRRHRLSVHGNIIGASVAASPLVDLLSLHGREVAFWTYRVAEEHAEFEPYYREERPCPPSPLKAMLDHLPWRTPPPDALVDPAGEVLGGAG